MTPAPALRTLAGSSYQWCAYGRWLAAGTKRKPKCSARATLGSIYCQSHRDLALQRVAGVFGGRVG